MCIEPCVQNTFQVLVLQFLLLAGVLFVTLFTPKLLHEEKKKLRLIFKD